MAEILKRSDQQILESWVQEQTNAIGRQKLLMKQEELAKQCREFINRLTAAILRIRGHSEQRLGPCERFSAPRSWTRRTWLKQS